MLITLGGIIGVGKSSMTQILSELLDTKAVYEPVEENPLLTKFYEDKSKYGFIFQIDMLSKRFEMIQEAMSVKNGILDRSIYEDSIFLDQLADENHVTKLEQEVYHKLLNRMLKELEPLPKKSPDLMIVLNCSFDEQIKRINSRAREFEKVTKGTELYSYFKAHHSNYQKWLDKELGFPKLVIDVTDYDFVNNVSDRIVIVEKIIEKLYDVNCISAIEAIRILLKLKNTEWSKENASAAALQLYNHMNGKMPFHELSQFTDNQSLYEGVN